jgi:hypothetical protein
MVSLFLAGKFEVNFMLYSCASAYESNTIGAGKLPDTSPLRRHILSLPLKLIV